MISNTRHSKTYRKTIYKRSHYLSDGVGHLKKRYSPQGRDPDCVGDGTAMRHKMAQKPLWCQLATFAGNVSSGVPRKALHRVVISPEAISPKGVPGKAAGRACS